MQTNKTLLIDAVYVQDFTEIEGNVDAKYLMLPILIAQEKYIKPILGTALYDELLLQKSGGTLTTLNETLLEDWVGPCLALYAQFKAGKKVWAKWNNAGIFKMRTQDGDSLTMEELDDIRNELLLEAGILAERLTRYLLAHTSDYPLYLQYGTGIDAIKPIEDNTGASGIFTPVQGKRRGYKYGYDKPSND